MSRKKYFLTVLAIIAVVSTAWLFVLQTVSQALREFGLLSVSLGILLGFFVINSAGISLRENGRRKSQVLETSVSPFPNYKITFASFFAAGTATISLPIFVAGAITYKDPGAILVALFLSLPLIPMAITRPHPANEKETSA